MVLGLFTHIDIRQCQGIGHNGPESDGPCCHAGYDIHIAEILDNDARHLHLHQIADGRVRQDLLVVVIHGRVPPASPHKRGVGLQLDGACTEQFLGD